MKAEGERQEGRNVADDVAQCHPANGLASYSCSTCSMPSHLLNLSLLLLRSPVAPASLFTRSVTPQSRIATYWQQVVHRNRCRSVGPPTSPWRQQRTERQNDEERGDRYRSSTFILSGSSLLFLSRRCLGKITTARYGIVFPVLIGRDVIS